MEIKEFKEKLRDLEINLQTEFSAVLNKYITTFAEALDNNIQIEGVDIDIRPINIISQRSPVDYFVKVKVDYNF